MRKNIYILFTLCLLSVMPIKAQPIMNYGFESKQGTYEPITGGTVVHTGVSSKFGDIAFDGQTVGGIKALATTTGIPIGFNFTYNDLAMNKFVVGSCGFLMLGKDNVKINPERSAFMLSGGGSDIGEGKQNVFGIGVNTELAGVGTTELSYKLTGNSPNRVLIVQFKDLQMDVDYSGTKTTVSLQIRLYETSNKIEFIFNNWANPAEYSSKAARVGLKGNDEDFQLRRSINEDWNNTEKKANDGTNDWSPTSFPANGLTYTFLPPSACIKPSEQPTELTLSSSSIMIEGSFKKTATADHYLVVMSEIATLSAMPVDKTTYKAGDKIGNGTVVNFTTETTFETSKDLLGSKNYYFHVFALNSFGAFGPIYNTTSPLTGNTKTLPNTPASIEVKENGYDYITLSATGNVGGDQMLIAMTDKTVGVEDGFPEEGGVFGTPMDMLNVGDKIAGGGMVIYKGATKNDIKIEGLKNNTVYHFIAWSLNSDNKYSSTFVADNETTWGKLPYEANLQNAPMYELPLGWESTGGSFRATKKGTINLGEQLSQLECDVKSGDPLNGKEHRVTTQWILRNNATHRVLLNYNLSIWSRMGTTPYANWDERDVLEVQVSNNGTDYTTIYTVNKDNVDKLETATSWGTIRAPFDNFKGEKVKVRLRWKMYAPSVKLLVESFFVEEKTACDYPIKLRVDQTSVAGSQALIGWTAINEENAWDIRFRKVGDENWGEAFEVRTNPYLLTTLPPSSNIEVQVRAKCSLTSLSPWSKTLAFKSGYALPFSENFNSTVGTTLPTGWSYESGLLGTPTEFCDGSIMGCQKNWSLSVKALKIRYQTHPKDWTITPKIDMGDGSYHGKLEFDLSLSKNSSGPITEDIYFAVVVSKDGGVSFNKADVVKELKQADFAEIGASKHYSVDLSQYKGTIKLGFYAYTEGNAADEILTLDNIALLETCPSVTNAKASEVTPETAVVTWEGEATEWLTFVRKAGETKKEFTKQSEAKLTLTKLTPKTNYEVGITKACAIGDTARVVIVSFTTQSLAPCLIPENVTATPSKKTVKINWEGEADRYNVRFRLVSSEEWIEKKTDTNSILVDGLDTNTEYAYSIQAVCSSAEGDVSAWTNTAKVTTLAVTCFAPTNIKTTVTHKSATISWDGEASNYELNYRQSGEWIVKEIKNAKTFTIDNLPALTSYTLRMRSICAVGDTSDWSANVTFKTDDIPVCSLPTNLRVSGMTDTGAKFEWDADASNLTWDIHYRPTTITQWTTLLKLTEKSYQANDLIPNTAYLWSVKATCDEERTSAWTAQETFNTTSAIHNIGGGELKVFSSNKVINILNPLNVKINRICIYGVNGQAIKEYTIQSDENVMIPTSLDADQVIIKIFGEGFTSSHNLIIR